ncbi:MAG: zf-HC2 domain-containing protein [Ignavibacteria bacterium]|nr:zf-HC2 domain-containing protein [Ignavibacteria bacterium]
MKTNREIDCREALKLIAAYVDQQSTKSDSKSLEKHLESCRHCFDRVEFEKMLKNRLKGLKLDTSSSEMSTEVRRFLEDL